jgi:nucleoside-diphosphate-sugar epimerase
MKKALVLGGGGFIGGHLVNLLMRRGFWVRSVDLKPHAYGANPNEFLQGDLTDKSFMETSVRVPDSSFDEIYQLAADMGGAGYIFTGENDANLMFNSTTINLNLLDCLGKAHTKNTEQNPKVFYSSSACIYPEERQSIVYNSGLKEEHAYPANPDSYYGWEKLYSERLFLAFSRNYGIQVRVGRFHNVYGPEGTWKGGREKAPAAICRKVAMAKDYDTIEIWGDGKQTRSFLFIDDCLAAVEALMNSNFEGPINIGSEDSISINELVSLASSFENKKIEIKHIPGPLGVRGRNSDNSLFREKLGIEHQVSLVEGLQRTYNWIKKEIESESLLNNSQ